jgi:hypothetical protein
MSYLDTEMIPRETLNNMVDVYQKSLIEIEKAYAILHNAKQMLQSAYGQHIGYDIIPRNSYDDLKGILKKKAWEIIIERLELNKIMSIQDLDKIRRNFEDIKKIPEIDLPTVMDIVIGMVSNQQDYAKRLVDEVYEILTPGRSDRNKYKTNASFSRRAVGRKVILTYRVFFEYGNTFSAGYNRGVDELMAIDRVFYALDGKSILGGNSYRSPLVDAINTTKKDGLGETEYFKYRCCLNKNLHLEFKRLDLVRKLNQIAGVGNMVGD